MIRYGELHRALSTYTNVDIHEEIPLDFYRRVIKACFRANNNGLSWDVHQAASILLYLAFNDGRLQPMELNAVGLKTLDQAEALLEKIQLSNQQRVVQALLSD